MRKKAFDLSAELSKSTLKRPLIKNLKSELILYIEFLENQLKNYRSQNTVRIQKEVCKIKGKIKL